MKKTVLITGANKGIGFATAQKFLSEGYNVILSGRNRQKINDAAARIANVRCKGMVWDISDIHSADSVIEKAHDFFGNINTFINNAGIVSKEDMDEKYQALDFTQKTENGWDETMQTTLKGVYFAIQAETRYMISHNIKGHIVNLCSEVAFTHYTGSSMYAISKWG